MTEKSVVDAIQMLIDKNIDEIGKEKVSSSINCLINNIEKAIRINDFYSIPLQNILHIINETHIFTYDNYQEILKILISRLTDKYPKQTSLLLHYIDTDDASIDISECISIFSYFQSSPLCVELANLYFNNESLPEIDWEYVIKQKEELIHQLREEIEKIKANPPLQYRPYNLQNDIFKECKSGTLSGVRWFIENEHVNINITNEDHETPVYIASYINRFDIVKYLIEKGADPNIPTKYQWTPLCRAIEKGHVDVSKYLIDHGANVNYSFDNGHTIMHTAALNHRYETIKHLYQNGASSTINAKNSKGITPLDYAYRSSMPQKQETIEYLLSKGARRGDGST